MIQYHWTVFKNFLFDSYIHFNNVHSISVEQSINPCLAYFMCVSDVGPNDVCSLMACFSKTM